MRISLPLTVLLLGLSIAGPSQGIEVENDRFTGKRSVSNTVSPAKGDLQTPIRVFKVAQEQTGQVTYGAIFMTVASEWRYLRCHSFDWLVDGEPMKPIEPAAHRGEVMRGGAVSVLEVMYMGLSREQFQQLADAQKVEYRICRDEFQLTGEDLVGIKEVLRLFDDPAAAPASEAKSPARTDIKPPASRDMKYVPRVR